MAKYTLQIGAPMTDEQCTDIVRKVRGASFGVIHLRFVRRGEVLWCVATGPASMLEKALRHESVSGLDFIVRRKES